MREVSHSKLDWTVVLVCAFTESLRANHKIHYNNIGFSHPFVTPSDLAQSILIFSLIWVTYKTGFGLDDCIS
jgi:hypothetical protein